MEGQKGPVCVTGGTGFIGSWLIMRLLDLGYYVRTTVRSDPDHKKNTSFLTSLPGASERLQIFNADLNNPESFNAPIEGCIGVFHVATPVDFEGKETEEVVTKRTISGALGILKACLEAKTVKRVVYTSASSAVVFNGQEVDEMDESFWSDVDLVKAQNSFARSYIISKTATERAVHEFGEKHGLDVVTIIPSYVVGPFICPKFPGSVRVVLAMVLGDKDIYSYLLNSSMAHIDDVASAHIFLLECLTAKGRYNCSSNVMTIAQMSELLSTRYPEYQIPTIDSLKEVRGNKIPSLPSKKLLDAGFKHKYGPIEMFDDAIQCCKEKGYL